MKRLVIPALVLSLLAAATAPAWAQQTSLGAIKIPGTPLRKKAKAAKVTPAYKTLMRKWIVRSVRRDGKPNAAQIGQKVGDVITVKRDGNNLTLG